jgi:hypothetical protein
LRGWGLFEERYTLLREATSVATLEALVADLVVDDVTPIPLLAPARVSDHYPAITGYTTRSAAVAPAESIRIPAVFGSAERSGTWTGPEHIEVMVTLGEGMLDFRDAVFSTDTVVIDISVLAGSLKITLPPGTQIENECEEFMSSSSHPKRRGKRAEPNGILVILRGRIRLGELSIKERPPTGEEPPRFKPFLDRLLGRPEL